MADFTLNFAWILESIHKMVSFQYDYLHL